MDEKPSSPDSAIVRVSGEERPESQRDEAVSFDAAVDDATLRLMRLALAFGFANSFVSIAVAGFSRASGMTFVIGAVWLVLWGVAVAYPANVRRLLENFVWPLTVAVCAGSIATVLLSGGFDSYLKTETNWLAWVATVVLSTRLVLLITSAISVSLLSSFLMSGVTINEIVSGPDRYTAVTDIINPFVIALAALAVSGTFRGLFDRVPELLAQMRAGDTSGAVPRLAGRGQLMGLPAGEPPTGRRRAPSPANLLTLAETEIVNQLAIGRTPQQIALASKRSEHTIYDHIKNAKRKVGAQTTPHLIARAWRPTN